MTEPIQSSGEEFSQEIRAIEQAPDTVTELQTEVDGIFAQIVALWLAWQTAQGTVQSLAAAGRFVDRFRNRIGTALRRSNKYWSADALNTVTNSYLAGHERAVRDGADTAAEPDRMDIYERFRVGVGDANVKMVNRVSDHLDQLSTLVGKPTDPVVLLAPVKRDVDLATRTISTMAISAANDGYADALAAAGRSRIWVAERDACVHCLAYAGETAGPGIPFALGLTFGDKPLVLSAHQIPLVSPPLHPHCRCVIQLWDEADTAVVDALKREAKRSVLRGFSLPSESEGARIRAAARLLAIGAGLPKTVEDRARRAVRAGRFPSRKVPTGETRYPA